MKEYVALDEMTFTIYICRQIGDKNWIRDNRCWGWQVVIVSSINNDQSSLAGNCYLVQSGYEILQKKNNFLHSSPFLCNEILSEIHKWSF